MQITETSSEGLRREYAVIVSSSDIESKITTKLGELKDNIRLPGFRPGKVPLALLRQRYGKSILGEVLEETVNSTSQQALTDQAVRPAMQPKIEITKFDEGSDLEYSMVVEIMPEIEPTDFSKIALEKLVVEPSDADLDKAIDQIAGEQKVWEPIKRARKARDGDMAVIDFKGTVDGEAFDGGSAEDYELVLGSNSFIPGFEDQVIGLKPGEETDVKVTFPADYGAENLAGKDAVFAVKVKELREGKAAEVNDEFAVNLGLENLADLREKVAERLRADFDGLSRQIIKRRLLDKLAEAHDFGVPAGLVDQEFDSIWHQFEHELEHSGETIADQEQSEEELRGEYRAIAERRVRLGLLLSEVGTINNIQVTQDEVTRAMMNEARRYPGQERQVVEFFQSNPQAQAQLRAPLFEDKVIDFVLEMAKLDEKKVTAEELIAASQDEEAAAAEAAKPKKKAKAKAAPKKKAAKAKAGDDAAAAKDAGDKEDGAE
ncbi:trigger factor [Oceanibacterium hippocampi]|uniref:Trigger factor n=1 Tax=Oceanibacterium hippocampi TaxID=745714 RepID=A0A1Y5T3G9_9PROT|nr:trigger factor [Oceanibacterium hippocampi]SLN53365.1 Trigger factor [Oceanibacterium hippocampi]